MTPPRGHDRQPTTPGEPARDQAARLRADLLAGRWSQLLDPLLPLVLLDDPGDWWRSASDECGRALLEVLAAALAPAERAAGLESWRLEVTPEQKAPMGWERTLREVRDGIHEAMALAHDTVLIERRAVLGILPAQRRLVRLLAARLPAGCSPRAVEAMTALGVLERYPAA